MRGETITLIHRVKAGEDPGGGIIWNTREEQVDDVLIQDGSQSNSTDPTRPDGIRTAKTIHMPRAWPYRSLRGAKARIDGVEYTVIGDPRPYTGGITPTRWNLTVELADTKITLGNIRQTYTQRMAAQQQALDKLVSNSGAWNSAAGGTGPYMKDLIDRINQIMNATGGYTYLKPGQGIYVYDKPEDQNPTQCIHIGGGYWRIADHKKPNGDWDFRALANGKGIFADTVFTGRLSDAAGLNYWDMDTGDFSLSARSTIGGKTVQQYADGAVSDANSYTDAAKQAAITEAKRQADAALSGAKTYAEAIMAYGSNLVRNPNGNPDHDLDKLGASKLTKTMPATHPEGITSAIHLGNVRDTYFGWPLDTFRGHTFRLSGWAYRKAGNVTSSFGIHWTDTGNGNHWQTIAQSAADANGWTYVSGSYTVPSNAKTARLWMQVDRNPATASDADWYWTGLQCTDETAARSYVDTFEGELTQTYIFNKLTNNGQKQGLYLSNGLLYINATYMKTGIITGKRSYWNLDTGQFVMTDANGNETVHLDGDGADNLLTGTFRTARTGNRVQISPSFKQTEISGTDSLEGAGIQFYHGSGSYQHPYIAVESTTQQEGEVSALTFNGGRRAEHDPGAFARIGERKADDNTTKVGTVFLAAEKDYDSTDPSSRRAYLSLWSPKTGATTATLAARDPNGLVGIQADIDSGYLYMGGFLGSFSGGRSTFQTAWWEGQNIGAMKYAQYTLTSSNPAKYGSYKAFATVDHRQDDPGLFVTTVSDCTASGWSIWVYTPPERVVTNMDASWNRNTSTGVVSNLSINTHYAALFQGNKPYQLHTIGFLKK